MASRRPCARDAVIDIAIAFAMAMLVTRAASEDCSVLKTCADCSVYTPATADCGWCALKQQCVLGVAAHSADFACTAADRNWVWKASACPAPTCTTVYCTACALNGTLSVCTACAAGYHLADGECEPDDPCGAWDTCSPCVSARCWWCSGGTCSKGSVSVCRDSASVGRCSSVTGGESIVFTVLVVLGSVFSAILLSVLYIWWRDDACTCERYCCRACWRFRIGGGVANENPAPDENAPDERTVPLMPTETPHGKSNDSAMHTPNE
jgi:hypothetical protein